MVKNWILADLGRIYQSFSSLTLLSSFSCSSLYDTSDFKTFRSCKIKLRMTDLTRFSQLQSHKMLHVTCSFQFLRMFFPILSIQQDASIR